MTISKESLAYLREQLRQARPMLMTGAGFSAGAKNILGKSIPLGGGLAQELWKLCFPNDPFEENSTLQDLYQHALARHREALAELLLKTFTVSPQSLPDYYATWFSIPWQRVYTLNVDDLEVAAASRVSLPRTPFSVSGAVSARVAPSSRHDVLEVVHLNGTLEDIPDKVTFSTSQYGRRVGSQDPAFHRLVGDLAGHPFVFVGTPLDESALWHHIELRGERGGRGFRELRPKSFLVSPSLARARRELLRDFNVEWIEANTQDFTAVLKDLEPHAAAGLAKFARPSAASGIPLVANLVADAKPEAPSFFLLGAEPEWRDVLTGRAVTRTFDTAALQTATTILEKQLSAKNEATAAEISKVLLISGTAGAGKSTALMRACVAVSATGKGVAWIDKDTEVSPRDIRALARGTGAPPVIAIDDADRYGMELASLVNDLQQERHVKLVLLAMRASRIERGLSPARVKVPVEEMVVPGLTDEDISGLIAALDKENRLGLLKGKTAAQREAAFRQKAGRQLLVAMLEATSDKRFEDKVTEEWDQLSLHSQAIYAMVALATSFRHALNRDDIVLGVGDLAAGGDSNETLNALSDLTRRHIITGNDDGSGCRARHRLIADVLLDSLQASGRLGSVHVRLAYVAATKVSEAMPRSARPWRLLKSVINHDYLFRVLGLDGARQVYENIESLLSWDFHYLLQRGSLEVEAGDIRLAQNLLEQAYSLVPSDPFVVTEYAYMLLKRASSSPTAKESVALAEEAIALLEEQIEARGERDHYPAHVLGSQVLSWTRRGGLPLSERERLLQKVLFRLDQAVRWHPRDKEIQQLRADVQREYLGLRVVGGGTPTA